MRAITLKRTSPETQMRENHEAWLHPWDCVQTGLGHAYWDTKKQHSLQSIQSIATSAFSLTGEDWVSRGGDTHQVSSGEKGPIRDLQTKGCWPRWSYLPAPDLGINFFLGHTTRYGWKSLVHLAAWKKHTEGWGGVGTYWDEEEPWNWTLWPESSTTRDNS